MTKPEYKSKCVRCKKEFTPTLNNIFVCEECLKKGLKKSVKQPLDTFMKSQAKKLGL